MSIFTTLIPIFSLYNQSSQFQDPIVLSIPHKTHISKCRSNNARTTTKHVHKKRIRSLLAHVYLMMYFSLVNQPISLLCSKQKSIFTIFPVSRSAFVSYRSSIVTGQQNPSGQEHPTDFLIHLNLFKNQQKNRNEVEIVESSTPKQQKE